MVAQRSPRHSLRVVKRGNQAPPTSASSTDKDTVPALSQETRPLAIESLTPKHLTRSSLLGFDAEVVATLKSWKLSDSECGFAALVAGKVVAIFAIMALWPGVAYGHFFIGGLMDKLQHQAVCQGIEGVRGREGLRRLQTDVLISDLDAVAWLRLMGFHCEGIMEAYGPDGEDYIRYARVWREE